MEILKSSATVMAEAIRQKQISSVELLDALLRHIEKVNPSINAIVQLDAQRARESAQKCDHLLAKGFLLGLFHGVPFTAKDIYNTQGILTTLGTLGLRNHIPDHDATVITALKNAGAILIGKTNVPEFCSSAETDNLIYGATKNPYDFSRTAGGSSGGEAAIIASAGSPFGIGSDSAGSLRIPAHFCGISTIRPSVGRVACSRNFRGLNPEIGIRIGIEGLLSADGPMARYVEDLYPLLKVISKPDGVDPNVVSELPLVNPEEVEIEELKIAYFDDNHIFSPAAEIKHYVSQSAKLLADCGAEMTEISADFMHHAVDILMQLTTAFQTVQSIEAQLISVGTKVPSPTLSKLLDRIRRESRTPSNLAVALANLDYYRSTVTQSLFPYDAVICPVLPFVATSLHDSLLDDHLFPAISYCVSFSLAQYPAAVVRVGQDEVGLPIGLQIVTKPWHEHIALAIAKKLEESLGGWQPPTWVFGTHDAKK